MIGEAGEVKERNCASLKSREVRPLPGMGNTEEGMCYKPVRCILFLDYFTVSLL